MMMPLRKSIMEAETMASLFSVFQMADIPALLSNHRAAHHKYGSRTGGTCHRSNQLKTAGLIGDAWHHASGNFDEVRTHQEKYDDETQTHEYDKEG
jgi:hypothetical protein